MSRRFARYSYFVAAMLVLLAGPACSITIDPFGAPAIPATIPAGPPSSTPGIIPPTIALATVTPTAIPPSATPAPAPVASPAIQNFKMLDANNGWAVSSANVLRTSDGGATWLNVTPNGVASLSYPAAFFMDAGRAWIVIPGADDTSGTLYRTQDGGSNWSSSPVAFAGGDLKFLDAQNGFILVGLGGGAGSEAVAVFQTSDAGGTWTRNYVNDPGVSGAGTSLPLGGDKSGMTFRDATHGWVSGETPVDNLVYLYASGDGGHTWALQNVVLPPVDNAEFGASAPIFFDQNTGVLPATIAATSNSTLFFATQDGGNTWMPTSSVPVFGKYSLVSATDAYVWDGGPILYVSHDGMFNWTQVHPNVTPGDNLSQIQFIDANTGWLLEMDASSHTSLYKTTDGGSTWTALIP